MKKQNRDSISYNAYKKNARLYYAMMYTFTIAYAAFVASDYSLVGLIILIFVVIFDVISTYLALHDPAYSTTATIDNNGISITFAGKAEPIFIPWSNDVYINVCIEGELRGFRQFIHNRVLCLSNIDAEGEYVVYDNSINMQHILPTDDYAPWFVFLVVSAKITCKREAKRVLAFKEAALAKK